MIEFENGLHPAHECDDPREQAANLRWFEQQWHLLPAEGCIGTDVCTYLKTATGFRRLTEEQDKEHMQAIIEERGVVFLHNEQGFFGIITSGKS